MLSPDDRKIPDDLWKIFSLKGEYIKNILLYSGYETIDSIMNLKNDCELTEAISFVKDMSELMDENEKKANFGIFSKQPEKLKVIPGLKPVVLRFIESVEKITKAESTVKFHQNATSKKKSTKRKKESENLPSSPSSEIIDKQLQKICNWIKSHKNFTKNFKILKGAPNNHHLSVNGTFTLVPIISPEGMRFTCQVCKTEVVLQMTPHGSIVLSNVHRHISQRCWLHDNFSGVKDPKSHNIEKLFKGPSSSGSKAQRGRDIVSASRKRLSISEIDISKKDDIDSELVINCLSSESIKCDDKNSPIDFDKTGGNAEPISDLCILPSSSKNIDNSLNSKHATLKDEIVSLGNVEQDGSIDSKNLYQPSGQNEATDNRGL